MPCARAAYIYILYGVIVYMKDNLVPTVRRCVGNIPAAYTREKIILPGIFYAYAALQKYTSLSKLFKQRFQLHSNTPRVANEDQ